MLQRHLDQPPRALGRHRAAPLDDFAMHARLLVGRQRWHARVAEQPLHEVFLQGRDQLRGIAGADLLGRRIVLGWNQHIDAVCAAADVGVDPAQLGFKLLGREGRRAEHAEAARLGHLDDDVAAMREGEDGDVASEPLANLGLHACLASSRTIPGALPRHNVPAYSAIPNRWTIGVQRAISPATNARALSGLDPVIGSMPNSAN